MKKLILLILALCLNFITSCSQDDAILDISNQEKESYRKENISFKEFLISEKNNTEIQKLNKYFPEKSQKNHSFINDWEIDTTKVVKITTNNLITYTFSVKEKSQIEGFRNIIVKKENNQTTNYIVHYPNGIDKKNRTYTNAILRKLDNNLFGKDDEGGCVAVFYLPVSGCSDGQCEWEIEIRQVPCTGGGSDTNDTSPDGGGSSSGDSGGGIIPPSGLPTDPIGGGGGGSSYSINTLRIAAYIYLDDYEKQWLTENPSITDKLLQLLKLNNYSSQSQRQIRWAVSYLTTNYDARLYFSQNPEDLNILFTLGTNFFNKYPNITWEDLKYLLHNKTSYESSLGDIDNNTIGGYDNTFYPDFDFQTHGWPNVSPIISKSNFIGWSYPGIERNCMDYAKAQIAVKGYVISNYYDSGQTFQIYTSNNGVNSSELSKGVSYLKYALTNDIPVIVGVDFKLDSPNPGTDNTTDHFVVIVGMGSDAKGMYLIFYDNAVSDPNEGANVNNRLYYNSTTKKFQGQSQSTYGVDKIYTITMIRKSKKK